MMSLERAFLGAGVPSVIASLWAVEDRQTEQLFHFLYQHLRRGESVVTSLRGAQLAMLAASDPAYQSPQGWAAFELFGSAGSN